MLSPSIITDWLQQPRPLTPAEVEAVDGLLREYPYFLPAHYMDAAEQYRKNPSPSPLQAMMQLYLGNWAFFHGMLQAAQDATAGASPKARHPEPGEPPAADAEDDATVPEEGAGPEVAIDWEPEGLEAAVLETHRHETSGLSDEDEEAMVPHPEPLEAPQEVDEGALQEAQGDADTGSADAFDEEDIDAVETEVPPQQEAVIQPFFTEDYFRHQGIDVSEDLPEEADTAPGGDLMVMRSFADWLLHFRKKKEETQAELAGKKALKAHWQKEKLAAALEEEDEEIPEAVFEMAVSSIRQEEPLVSESMAAVYLKQGKWGKAIEVYRRLQAANPAKSTYFAAKIAAAEQQKSLWSS